MSTDAKIIAYRREVGADLYRAKNDLYFLCTEILGYAWSPKHRRGLTEDYHKPMCDRRDRLREHERVATFAHRGSHKTTAFVVGSIIQDILRNPDETVLLCHAVDEEACKTVQEIGTHFLRNVKLRKLAPGYAPIPSKSARWLGSDRFTVLSRTKYDRQPTVLAKGAGSEFTGAHVNKIYLDDIVARRTIENSELPKAKSWLRNTVLPVLNPNGKLRGSGTRWDIEDPYQDWIDSGDWDVEVRAALETDGKPDYKGKPVHYGPEYGDKVGVKAAKRRIERLRKEMGPDFAPQMMNDPSPAGEKPWVASECEHDIGLKAVQGTGTVFVLSDPAPAKTGSYGGQGESERKDGTKDYWANAVVKIRPNGNRQEIILLDGTYSRAWSKDEGFDEVCRLAKKWCTGLMGVEATGQAIALYLEDLRRAARKMGCAYHQVKLAHTYKGKNQYFAALASRAKNDEFMIADSCPPEFKEEFLHQARNWRPITGGKNALKYDDVANVVSFATDPALQEYTPKVAVLDPWEEFEAESDMPQRSRYCAI